MRFDLNQGSKGEWFLFFGSNIKAEGEIEYLMPEADAGEVCLRIISTDAIDRIHAETRKKVAENVVNPKTRAMERISYIDQTPEQERRERELIWDHAIVDWKNILDMDGNQIPCTTENKLKMMNIPVFARFVARSLQLIGEAKEVSRAAAEKN